MAPTQEQIDAEIREERKRIAVESALVRLCQKREDKFRAKYRRAEHNRKAAARHHKPRKVEFYERRKARDKRKVGYWHRRELDAIEVNRDAKEALARLINQKRALQVPKVQELVDWELKQVGVVEGSKVMVDWAHDLGYSAALPWCSIFQGFGIKHILGVPLPPNPAYSGSWISWKHGTRINKSQARPGDLLIFDWGDGGLTDHVALYTGHGLKVGGNENNRVEHDAVPWSNVVAVVRIQV